MAVISEREVTLQGLEDQSHACKFDDHLRLGSSITVVILGEG